MSESKTSPIEQPIPALTSIPVDAPVKDASAAVVEVGGRAAGLDPVRYGDWELNGRCIDF